MDDSQTLAALAALAQPTRLQTFRLLVAREPEGVPAGELARLVGVPQNTMSAHLGVLSAAGLVRHEREGRSIVYSADLDAMQALLTYLMDDCCGRRPELCQPLLMRMGDMQQEETKHG